METKSFNIRSGNNPGLDVLFNGGLEIRVEPRRIGNGVINVDCKHFHPPHSSIEMLCIFSLAQTNTLSERCLIARSLIITYGNVNILQRILNIGAKRDDFEHSGGHLAADRSVYEHEIDIIGFDVGHICQITRSKAILLSEL